MGFKWAIRILSFFCMACMCVSIIFVKERSTESNSQNKLTLNSVNEGGEEYKDRTIVHEVSHFFDSRCSRSSDSFCKRWQCSFPRSSLFLLLRT